MPWSVKKVDNKYKLWNTDKKQFVNKTFNTRQSAVNTKKIMRTITKKKIRNNK